MYNDPFYIVVHHSATSDRKTLNDFDSIKEYHMSYAIDGYIVSKEEYDRRKAIKDGNYFKDVWSDVGYHFIIEIDDGIKIRKGRDIKTIGAHAYQKMPDRDNKLVSTNKQSVGICVVGNYDKEYMREDVRLTLIGLINVLRLYYLIPYKNIVGHREIRGVKKTCPGINVDMDVLRQDVIESFE